MEIEHKFNIINRFDSNFAEINNKGIFILTINTFIIGAFLVGYKDLSELISCEYINLFKYLVFLTLFSSLLSILITVNAIKPYLDSNSSSFIFFNDIANKDKNKFIEEIDLLKEPGINRDLNEQIYYLSLGLKKKHQLIKDAININLFQLIIILILIFLIIF